MKRLIKFTDKYPNDNGKFSNCSTEYEVLPVLVPDDADESDLELIALDLGYKFRASAFETETRYRYGIYTTHALKIGSKMVEQGVYLKGNKEKRNEYLGFITLPRTYGIEPVEDLSGVLTKNDIYEKCLCDGNFGIRDIATIDNEKYLIVESWDAFHGSQLMGYQDFKGILKTLDIEESVFDDSVFQCSECGEWDWNDSGYTYNYRIIDCNIYGINCGCAHTMQKELSNYINNSDQCIESEPAEELVDEGKIEVLETFIGGMVDGRGGYINGKSVREGQPKTVLEKFQEKYPGTDFVFIHEESGQFQTYFSIAKVI